VTAPRHIVLGAGQVGSEIARQLAAAGEPVAVATRTGRDAGVAGAVSARIDATDPASVRAGVAGAEVAYFAVQPAYTRWTEDFPPLVDGILGGLRGTGTRLVVVDNLYMYGPTAGAPIREDLPYAATNRKGTARARVASRLLDADRAGDVRVAIGRASDFFGPGATDTAVGDRFFGPIVAGRRADVYGRPDLPHTFTYVPDFARALIELGRHEDAFGRAWHVPSAPAVGMRAFAEAAATAAGGPLRTRTVGRMSLRLAGMFIPEAREMIEMAYAFEEPYVVDDSAIRDAFGVTHTPLEVSIPATVAWFAGEQARGGAEATVADRAA
jgi:nucleoside-diphosphate-sugar epimerase